MASATEWADPADQGRIRVRLAFDWDTDAIEAALKLNDVIEVLEPGVAAATGHRCGEADPAPPRGGGGRCTSLA